jgi:hypothetical protein
VTTYAELGPDEHRLGGARTDSHDGAAGDDIDGRILWLVRHRLRPRASANGGWDQLFIDPRDDRYWELTFPRGTLFGGGPRQLTALSNAEAAAKYGV